MFCIRCTLSSQAVHPSIVTDPFAGLVSLGSIAAPLDNTPFATRLAARWRTHWEHVHVAEWLWYRARYIWACASAKLPCSQKRMAPTPFLLLSKPGRYLLATPTTLS